MGQNGATRSYWSSQKNHWRRTVWNEVIGRAKDRIKQDLVLYLPGPDDIDRGIATSKGVPSTSMVGIDRDIDNVKAVRANGGLAVQGDLVDVLWSWPDDRKVCAVVFDFCAGIVSDNYATWDALQTPAFRPAACACNFQRGRDPHSNRIRDWADQGRLQPPPGVSNKHRGWQYVVAQVVDMLSIALGVLPAVPDRDGNQHVVVAPSDAAIPVMNRLMANTLDRHDMKFLTYTSGDRVKFDTVIWSNDPIYTGSFVQAFEAWTGRSERQELAAYQKAYREPEIVRRIAATMAVRTMKKEGVLA